MRRFKAFYISLFILALVTSCSLLYAFREIHEIPDWKWASKDLHSFTFESSSHQNLDGYFILRHVHGFQYNNISIEAKVISESRQLDTTFTVPIRDEHGDYLGEGAGDLWDIEHVFLTNQPFEPGTYTLTFQQKNADPLPLVMEVGVKLVESNQVD